MPISGNSLQEGSLAQTSALSAPSGRMEAQLARQERCEKLMSFQIDTFELIVQRITCRPYSNADFEVSSVQLPALEECLKIFRDVMDSILLNRTIALNEYWLEIVEMFISAIEATPQSMLHVHVRDMRYTAAGLLDEAYADDPLEYSLVYDLSYNAAPQSARAFTS